MAETQPTVKDTPAATPAVHGPDAATTTANEATADPVRSQGTTELTPDSRPELNAIGATDGTTASAPTAPNVSNVPKEEKVGKGEVLVESHAINEGILNYKGPGLKGLIFSKKYFWFSDAPLEHKHLSAYLGNEKSKDIAHSNAAHAQQTGKGLLFFAKRAEDKEHPQGIFNLADISDVAKGNFNDFGFTIHGHKHLFQAITKAEKDGWLVALETRSAVAKTARDDIVGSSGYKSALEKYGTPAAATTTGTARSLSRPGKKASKSRERKAAEPKVMDNSKTPTTETKSAVPAESTAKKTSDTPVDPLATSTTTGEKTGEGTVGGAAVSAAATTATRSGSSSDEDKKTKKSRSQSRNKRGSLFGNLLAKKEEHDVKKEIKKEEKEEKKEEKAEEKAIKKEIKREEKAEEKAEKQELKQETKAEKKLEQESNPLSTGATPGFNAHDVAARVVDAPVIPAGGNSTATDDISPVAGASATPAATSVPNTATETVPSTSTRETAPKPNKRGSLFGGFFGKKDPATPATTEASPAVPAKDEPSTVSSTAPQLDNPVTEPGTNSAPESAVVDSPTGDAVAPGATTTPTDKRRSSFFSNLGTKKERRTGTTSGDDMTDAEAKKQSSGGFGGLLRKASRAQKGNTAVKDAAEVPLPKETKETPAATTSTEGAAGEKQAVADGDLGTSSKTGTNEQTPVSAAA